MPKRSSAFVLYTIQLCTDVIGATYLVPNKIWDKLNSANFVANMGHSYDGNDTDVSFANKYYFYFNWTVYTFVYDIATQGTKN